MRGGYHPRTTWGQGLCWNPGWLTDDGSGAGRTFRIGKHRDEKLADVALTDPDYLKRLLESIAEVPKSDRESITKALAAAREAGEAS